MPTMSIMFSTVDWNKPKLRCSFGTVAPMQKIECGNYNLTGDKKIMRENDLLLLIYHFDENVFMNSV